MRSSWEPHTQDGRSQSCLQLQLQVRQKSEKLSDLPTVTQHSQGGQTQALQWSVGQWRRSLGKQWKHHKPSPNGRHLLQ